ncbi:ABC transporter substrate-binding protein [Sungkyunkwania multivorans]|uniref:ABC transporter substrate-binding protein n=1 Tax=Sungkyunkwania multivorans TaxID=1173618 RepID=A0ABW3D023_9FLAO
MVEYRDQLQRTIRLAQTPKRIISLVPSQTELLYDLGLENEVMGITKFCVHPSHFRSTKNIVGGTKQVKLDKIIALAPDIILCNKEENTKEMVAELETIAPVHVSDIANIDDCIEMIQQYGTLFDRRTEASNIVQKIAFDLDDFQKFIKTRPIKKVAYFIWRKPWMVVGKDTFINYLLELNHFENVYKHKGRYPEIDLENLRSEGGGPEVVFLSSEPYPFKEDHAFEIARYVQNGKTVFVDGELFSWYGSRLTKSFEYFKDLHQRLKDNS